MQSTGKRRAPTGPSPKAENRSEPRQRSRKRRARRTTACQAQSDVAAPYSRKAPATDPENRVNKATRDMGIFNFFSKKENKEDLNKGLEKTKEGVFSKLARAVAGKSKVDDEVLDNLEEVLITSDVGVDHDAAHHRTDRKARGRGQVHEYGRAERHSPQRNHRPARGEPSRGRAGIRLRKKGRGCPTS